MRGIAAVLPESVKAPLRRAADLARRHRYRGTATYCPVCGRSSCCFAPYGIERREDAECVHCKALERHRLLWLFVSTRTNLFDGRAKRMLHIAPEPCIAPRYRRALGGGYLSADLYDERAMVRMDVTDIPHPDESFDVIHCSQVLEYVRDDRKAMRELRRVLKSDGWAVLHEPIGVEETHENPSILKPQGRPSTGWHDIVWLYGPDFTHRLREAGFSVEVVKANDLASDDEAVRMGLTAAAGDVWYCTK
jgi:SAM-dependent methyltransferase